MGRIEPLDIYTMLVMVFISMLSMRTANDGQVVVSGKPPPTLVPERSKVSSIRGRIHPRIGISSFYLFIEFRYVIHLSVPCWLALQGKNTG